MTKRRTTKKVKPTSNQITFRYTPEATKAMPTVKVLTNENTNNKAINRVIQMYPGKIERIKELENQVSVLNQELKEIMRLKDNFLAARKALETYKPGKEAKSIQKKLTEHHVGYMDY